MQLSTGGGIDDPVLFSPGIPVEDVVTDRGSEQESVLLYDAEGTSEGLKTIISEIFPIEADAPRSGVIKT